METAGANEQPNRQSFGVHSLTWRLVAWILGSVGLVYLGTLLYSDSLSRDLIVAGAENEAVNVTRAYVKDIGDGLRSVEERTELLAEVLGTLAPSKVTRSSTRISPPIRIAIGSGTGTPRSLPLRSRDGPSPTSTRAAATCGW